MSCWVVDVLRRPPPDRNKGVGSKGPLTWPRRCTRSLLHPLHDAILCGTKGRANTALVVGSEEMIRAHLFAGLLPLNTYTAYFALF